MPPFGTKFLVALFSVMLFASSLFGQSEGTAQQNLGAGPYQLLPNSNSSACVDVTGGFLANGTPIITYQCSSNKQPNQLWKLVPVTGNAGSGYEVVSVNSGSCLDVSGVSQNDGAVVNQYQCLGGNQTNQVWQFIPFGSSFELVSLNSGKCLDIPNGNSANRVQIGQWTCGHGNNPNQIWNLKPAVAAPLPPVSLSGSYQMMPVSNGSACADVSGGGSANGTPVISFRCNGTSSPNQIWKLVPIQAANASGYQIVSANSGSCIDVAGVSLADGAPTNQWQCLGAAQTNQIWQVLQFGSSYEFVSLNSGKCLDLPSGNSSDGMRLQQWACGDGKNTNQLWNLKPVTSAPVATVAPTTAALQATPTTAVTGQYVSLTAKVASTAGVPVSNVNFFDGNTLIGSTTLDTSGVASLTTSSLANGAHMMTAQYANTARFASSTSPQVQVVVTQSSKGEQAFQSDSFTDSVGVATHLAYDDTAYYQQWPAVFSELKSLGVRHVRDGFYNWASTSPYIAEHRLLANAGIKTTYVVPIDNTTTPQIVANFAAMTGDVEALEGPNECDAVPNCGGGNFTGIKNVLQFLPTVYAAGKAINVPVLGPSFTQAEAYAATGNISSLMTQNNLHVYFGGRNPGSTGWGGSDPQGNNYGSFDWWLDQASQNGPNVPSVITEAGYLAFPGKVTPYSIPESVEATYMPRLLSLAFNHGIKRTFLYELLDENAGTGYGLLRTDLSEKPAFVAVKNLLSLLSDTGDTFAPGKLDYTINGGGPTLAHTLLQKRDGSFYLMLWLEESAFDLPTSKATPVAPQTITLSLNGVAVAKQVIRFDNTGNITTLNVDGSGTVLPLTITDQMSVIRITPQ